MLLKRRCKRKHWVWTGLQKVHSHVTSAFAISLDLCRLVLENANVKCEHNHFLPLTLFLTFDTNLCKRKSYVWTRLCNGWTRSVSTPFWSNYIVTVVTVRNSSYGKVMFSQACVKNSVHSGGGGVSALLHAGIHPPKQTPPPVGQNPPGRHPPAQCILGYTPPAQCMLG